MLFNNNNIIMDDNKNLKKKSKKVVIPLNSLDLETLIGLREYVISGKSEEECGRLNISPSVGIAAPQVDIRKQMFAVYINDENGNVLADIMMVNPFIVSHSKNKIYLQGGEGCLSVNREIEGIVQRYETIKVRYYNENNELIDSTFDGLVSIVVQHELDHLHGIMFYDHINKENPFLPEKNSKELGEEKESDTN